MVYHGYRPSSTSSYGKVINRTRALRIFPSDYFKFIQTAWSKMKKSKEKRDLRAVS